MAAVEERDDSFEVLKVSSLTDDDYSNWMGNLPNEKQLCPIKDLVIPGSHNAGAYFLHQDFEVGPDEGPVIQSLGSMFGKVAKSVVHAWGITQTLTIYQQLMAGIRYLDLRVALRKEDNQFRVLHGLYGIAIEEALEDVKRFMVKHPKEIVILDFNHFYNMDCTAHQRLADTLLAMFSEIFRVPGEERMNVSLQDMWGNEEKVIILYHDYEVISCYPCFWPPHSICAPWPNTSDKKLLLQFLDKHCAKSAFPLEAFHVCQAVLTPQTSTVLQNLASTLKDVLAMKCNHQVCGWLKALCGSQVHKFNIIMADFVEYGEFIPIVISLNYYY